MGSNSIGTVPLGVRTSDRPDADTPRVSVICGQIPAVGVVTPRLTVGVAWPVWSSVTPALIVSTPPIGVPVPRAMLVGSLPVAVTASPAGRVGKEPISAVSLAGSSTVPSPNALDWISQFQGDVMKE